MHWIDAIWLALLQGVTEFLPISSSAHLILPSQLWGQKDQGLAFDIAVHAGSLTAVLYYFRAELKTLLAGCAVALRSRQMNTHAALGLNLLIATVPIAICGVLVKDIVAGELRNIAVIATTTIVFGVLLIWADRQCGARRHEQSLTTTEAFYIGLAQAIALIPGVSRSGIVMTACLLLKLDRQAAARFAFLLSIPTIAGASLLQAIETLTLPQTVPVEIMGIGFVTSMVAAFFCIGIFLRFIDKIGLLPFAIYRVILGCVLLLLI